MEDLLKSELKLSVLKTTRESAGGCISSGQVYETNKGKIFVKANSKAGAKVMLEGEFASLLEISQTNTVKVPDPIKVISKPPGALLVTEYLNMTSLHCHAKELGTKLAELHMSNVEMARNDAKLKSSIGYSCKKKPITSFGFDVTTCCGYLPLVNSWHDNWVEFYARNRLKPQLEMVERDYNDREARELWPQLERTLPKLIPSTLKIYPSLLHGDLWSGNAAELDSCPCVFDPAAFYGHSEFDLAISHMFGGFPHSFFDSYHSIIPKADGFRHRIELYKLFHYLNHWNHFGGGYRESSLSIMRKLVKLVGDN